MIYLQFADSILTQDGLAPIEDLLLQRAALEAMETVGASTECDLTIVLTDDSHLQELNQQFLGIDAPTDVLSFPIGETDLDSETLYLGDVVISYPNALAQASAGGHPAEDEIQLLVVHGVLHLLGYDHNDEDQQAAMWSEQARILSRLGSSIIGPAPLPPYSPAT